MSIASCIFPPDLPEYKTVYSKVLSVDSKDYSSVVKRKAKLCVFYIEKCFDKDGNVYLKDAPIAWERFNARVNELSVALGLEDVVDSVFSYFYSSVCEKMSKFPTPPRVGDGRLYDEELDALFYFEGGMNSGEEIRLGPSDCANERLLKYYCFARYGYAGAVADVKTHWDKVLAASKQLFDAKSNEINYLGLSNAFTNLVKEKEGERKSVFYFLVGLGFVVCALPMALAYYYLCIWKSGVGVGAVRDVRILLPMYAPVLPVAAVEFVLLYYFRISLKIYLGVKSQILQLKFRHNVCAFVSNYKELKDSVGDDPTRGRIIGEGFERLIFSPIVPNDDKIPSTFDGIEQLASLVKACK